MYLNIAPYSLLFFRYISDEWFYYIYFILFLVYIQWREKEGLKFILAYNYTTSIVTAQY